MFPTYEVIFYIFAAILVISAGMVITRRQPVQAVLYLVLCFIASSVLWMMLQAEFLSLVLIFVYVGAVMTLFLFVVMMLNLDVSKLKVKDRFIHFLPVGFLAMALLVAIMIYALTPKHMPFAKTALEHFAPTYNNTQQIGNLLYSDYILPFEIAGLILLVAIIGAITLAFYGPKPGTKTQKLSEQHKAEKKDRLRIIDLKADKT